MALKCLVFDCDGVILDSVPVKTRAFARLAEPYGQEAMDRFVMYHARHGGVSRYLKFEWFFREILGRQISERESAEWAKKFEEYALDEVRKCPLVPGARETLVKWHGILPMFVCSGAPRNEVSFILEERGLKDFFVDILGSPPVKEQLLHRVVNDLACVLPEEALMIGDAITDRDAALANETQFYAVGPDLKGSIYPWSEDLRPLNAWIDAHI